MQPKAHRTGADMVAHTMSAPVFCLTANPKIMVYTFAKRKELNEMTERRYPEVSFQWQRDGLPRMHCALRPKNTEEIQSAKALEVYAYRYWTQYRKPLPVFVTMMPTKCGVEYYDVNYVSHLSPQSMAIAARYVGDHRLFAEPILLSDNT